MSELKRRNVFRVAIAYLAAAWLITEVAGTVFPVFGIPEWAVRFIVVVLALGFVPTLVFSWAYELTPEGLKREAEVVREESITRLTAKRLDKITIGLVLAALAVLIVDRFWFSQVVVFEPEMPTSIVSPDPNSIAVLAFVNMSDDRSNEYFSDGISEELVNVLSRVDGLDVASRTSSFRFKGTDTSVREIALDLDVSYVLEGSVRKAGNRVRITAQLIEAASDRHLWSDTYDRELVDIFEIQNEIANAIVASIKGPLGAKGQGVIVPVATQNMSAYDLYLDARGLFRARTDLERSIELFEQAVEIDPQFARAWEELSAVYTVMPTWDIYETDYRALSIEAAHKAIALDGSLSLAFSALGHSYQLHSPYRWAESLENFEIAEKNDPKNATNYLMRSIALGKLGYIEKALTDVDRCLEIDPHYENCRRHKAMYFVLLGENARALSLYRYMLESNVPGRQPYMVHALAASGNRIGALLAAERFTRQSGAPVAAWVDLIEDPDADRQEALRLLDRWLDREDVYVDDYLPLIAAFASDHVPPQDKYVTFVASIWLPQASRYRKSAAFKTLVRSLDMPEYWRKSGFPPQCRPVGDDDFTCD